MIWLWFLLPSLKARAMEVVPLRIGGLYDTEVKVLIKTPPSLHRLPPFPKRPVVYVFGGFEEAGKVLDLFESQESVTLVSFDYPFQPPRKFSFPSSFGFAPQAKRAAHATLKGINRVHQQLLKSPLTRDGPHILVGASFGAPFVIAAAAQASKSSQEGPPFDGLVILHGFARIAETAQALIAKSWEKKVGIIGRFGAFIVAHLGLIYLQFPTPEESVPQLNSHLKVLMISAQDDSFIPKESKQALIELFKKSGLKFESLDLPGDHLKPGAKEQIEQLKNLTLNWMKKEHLGL